MTKDYRVDIEVGTVCIRQTIEFPTELVDRPLLINIILINLQTSDHDRYGKAAIVDEFREWLCSASFFHHGVASRGFARNSTLFIFRIVTQFPDLAH